MKRFILNGYLWKVQDTSADNPLLIDRTGKRSVAVTDPQTLTVYISRNISEPFRTTVLIHELAHCLMFSYGYIERIRMMTYPEYRIDMEEMIANMFADHLYEIYLSYYSVVGRDAIYYLPYHVSQIAL